MAIAVKPDADAVEPVENADTSTQLAIATDPESVEDEDAKWADAIDTATLSELLKSQDIKAPSPRTLQRWADKSKGTKEGFSPAYAAKNIKNKLMWIPA